MTPKTPKKKERPADADLLEEERSSWGKDQAERGYYYDDAHGYEVYKPEEDDEEGD